jgi:DNA-binding NtrC family response regulator
VDVRIVATSNRDLNEAVDNGVFREDLYHRLAVLPLKVPSLQERISDVPLLVKHFVKKYCEMYGLPEKTVSSELMSRFESNPWPGNVRQLENLIHRGVLLSAERETVEEGDVYDEFFTEVESGHAQNGHAAQEKLRTIEDVERHMIMQTLKETNNNQQKAAEILGISARTIRNKLRKYRDEGYIT